MRRSEGREDDSPPPLYCAHPPHRDFVGRVRQRLYRKLHPDRQRQHSDLPEMEKSLITYSRRIKQDLKSAVAVTSSIVSVSRQVRNNSCGGDAMDGDGDKAESTAVTESKMNKEPSTATKSNSEGNPNPVKQAHSDDDSGCALEEYTWVPPGLKPDQVGTSECVVTINRNLTEYRCRRRHFVVFLVRKIEF